MRQLLSWLTDTPTWNLRTQHCSPSCWLRAVERTTCIWRLLRCDRNFKTRKSRQIPPFVRAACCCHATLAIARVSLCPVKRKEENVCPQHLVVNQHARCSTVSLVPRHTAPPPTFSICTTAGIPSLGTPPVQYTGVTSPCTNFWKKIVASRIELARSVCYALGLFLPH
jgi:hypothetical protein